MQIRTMLRTLYSQAKASKNWEMRACSQQLKMTKFKKSHAQPQCTAAVSSTDCLNLWLHACNSRARRRDAMAPYPAFGRAVDIGKLSFLRWSRGGRYATPPRQGGEDSFQSTTVCWSPTSKPTRSSLHSSCSAAVHTWAPLKYGLWPLCLAEVLFQFSFPLFF